MGKLLLQQFLEDEKTKRGLSGNQFAAYLDISPQTLSNYVSTLKHKEPRREIVEKIALKTNTTPYFLRMIIDVNDDEIDFASLHRLKRFYSLSYSKQARIIGAIEAVQLFNEDDQKVE